MDNESYTFEPSTGHANRLDLFLSVRTGRSRAFVKSQIEKSAIDVNGEVVTKPSHRLRPGDVIGARFEAERDFDLIPVEARLDILYEDADVLVLNKQQGWVVHPAAGHRGETVVHYLLHYLRNCSDFSQTSLVRPGIVHRLDRGTSGCLLVAKNRTALESLCLQFKNRAVKKQYEAIAFGVMNERGTFRSSIGRHPADRKRMTSRTLGGGEGREAETEWVRLQAFNRFSHVALFPLTGRTHQLRVHLTENGHAIVGDPVYGKRSSSKSVKGKLSPILENAMAELKHPFLHAKALHFFQPTTGDLIQVEATRPANFQKFLSLLSELDKEPRDES
jgi:23S rRNA pseudouridine1911/1915/1917 synthase